MATTTKQNNQYCTTSPSIDANIGPWDSISAYTSWLSGTLGVDTPQEGTEILVTNGNFNRMTKYRYETISGVARWTMVDSFYYNGLTTNADSLNSSSDVGIYFLYTAFLKGMLSVSVDFNGDIVQHLLANQTPVYENGSIASYTKGGTYLVRIYDVSTSTWSVWESVASGSSAADAVTDVAYDSTNNKITKTVNGTTSDVVTAAALKLGMNLTKNDVGLGNVNNTADANKSVASATMATQDANGNVISSTYETKSDATAKQTELNSSISAIQEQVEELTGIQGVNFGGIVSAATDIATDYTNKGYTGVYLYMVGSDMASLVAYQYSGSGEPIVLFNGDTYDFTDYSEVLGKVNKLIETSISENTIDLTDVEEIEGRYIVEGGTWANVENAKIAILELPTDANYVNFVATTYNLAYAFLRTNTITVGEAPDFAGDATTRTLVASGSSKTEEIPSDANYLYIVLADSHGVDRRSTYTVTFLNLLNIISLYNSIVIINGEIQELYKEIGTVEHEYTIYGYLKPDGTVTSTTSYLTTDYIAVESGKAIVYNGQVGPKGACVVGYTSSSGDGATVLLAYGDYTNNSQTITIPEGINYVRASVHTSGYTYKNLVQSSSLKGYVDVKIQEAKKSWIYGLNVAIMGDSISTNGNSLTRTWHNAYEIIIGNDDVGVELSAYPTYFDVQNGLVIGGHTFTQREVGTEVTFTPTAGDVGKGIGCARDYNQNNRDITPWWVILAQNMGFNPIPVCFSGSAITRNRTLSSTTASDLLMFPTSYAWHEAQIRKCGIRTAGTMTRTAPDVIIVYRGTNDMTHEPYTKLTDGYFGGVGWSYPTDDLDGDGNYGFKEGYALLIKKLREAYPTAYIILCTLNNFKRVSYNSFPVNNGINTIIEYNDAIREVANFFGCGLIEFDKDGITFENMYPTYISDSSTIPTHPNDTGHLLMASKAQADIAKMFKNDI